MHNLTLISLTVLISSCFVLFFLWYKSRSFGILKNETIYSDTEENPGEILVAKTVPLRGKPDYLIKDGKYIIPVEYKSGKTPSSPYLNHTMQLMAYCLLVEETYGIRPPGGYIRYPQNEFKIAYTSEAETSLRQVIG
jgi:CRISPR-associated exonuclease Cas4